MEGGVRADAKQGHLRAGGAQPRHLAELASLASQLASLACTAPRVHSPMYTAPPHRVHNPLPRIRIRIAFAFAFAFAFANPIRKFAFACGRDQSNPQ